MTQQVPVDTSMKEKAVVESALPCNTKQVTYVCFTLLRNMLARCFATKYILQVLMDCKGSDEDVLCYPVINKMFNSPLPLILEFCS